MNTKLQVLVIDDDAVVGRSFDRVLSGKGYEVSTALTGEEGLKDIESTNYDVVFTDIRMPGMDGLEVAERIKARCPWTPVVVITGYGTEENEARASVLGVNGFVHKPLTPEIIESITLKALEEAGDARQAASEPEATTEINADAGISGIRKVGTFAKNVGLFFAAPFIALGYVIALPFVGFYMIAKLGKEAIEKKVARVADAAKESTAEARVGGVRKVGTFLKNVGLFFAAPFIALGYVIALPFVGFYMIAKLSKEAIEEKRASS
jgi:CheY-like chemotaxis protein